VLFLAGHRWATGAHATGRFVLKGGRAGLGDNIERVARVLFTDFLWPFEITAGLLVIAVVGSVVLARRSGQRVEMVEEDADQSEESQSEESQSEESQSEESQSEESQSEESELETQS
jgi:NADH-quinone oxidoreductase subunit J